MRVLLGGRFEILGLGGYGHAVLQIGGDDGLLLGACTEVQAVDVEGLWKGRSEDGTRSVSWALMAIEDLWCE